MLAFTGDVARFLNDAYEGHDAAHRRSKSLRALGLAGGETVVDLGCGAGHLSVELARAVGPQGTVICIDPALPMREKTLARVAGRDNVQVIDASAEHTQLHDASVDAVIAIQVFSYLQDLTKALEEVRRVLKPDGKLVVSDIHWGGAIWASSSIPLERQIIDYWASQLKNSRVPQYLPALARQVGFQHCSIRPVTIVDQTLRPDGLAHMLMVLIEQSAQQQANPLQSTIQAWVQEQHTRARSGQFFFSVTNFICALS